MAEHTRDLLVYDNLQARIYDPDQRGAAIDSVFSLWEESPAHVLWPELASRNRRFFRDRDRFDAFLENTAPTDTSTAIGAYLLGWRMRRATALTRQFQTARAKSKELDAFSAQWLELKASFGARIGGNLSHALEIAYAALEGSRQLGGPHLEALNWTQITRILLAQSDLDDALHAVVMAEQLHEIPDTANQAVVGLSGVRNLKASILAARGDVAGALDCYERNVDMTATAGISYLAYNTLNLAATLAEVDGQRQRSLSYCKRGLDLALGAQDSLNIPRFLMNVAKRLRLQGDLDGCRSYQDRAIRWVEDYSKPTNLPRLPLMLSEYYAQIGSLDVVDSLLTSAAELSSENNSNEAKAELHLELIRGWMEVGRPDLVYRSMNALDGLGGMQPDRFVDRNVTADINLLLGEFLTQQNDFILASESLDRAQEALSGKPDKWRNWKLSKNRGVLARERGDSTSAETAFRACLKMASELATPELESTSRFLLGSSLLETGNYSAAREAFPPDDPAEFVGRAATRIATLLFRGISYQREERHELALEYFDTAQSVSKSWTPLKLTARIALEAGRSNAALGRPDSAQQLYDSAIQGILRSEGKGDTKELAYFTGNLRRNLLEAVIELSTLEAVATLQLACDLLPRWKMNGAGSGDALRPSQILFFVGERISGRWDVLEDTIRWHPMPSEEELHMRLAPVLADLSSPGRPVGSANLLNLSTLLLHGVDSFWKRGETLIIVPDLALFGVPWSALSIAAEDGNVLDHGSVIRMDRPVAEGLLKSAHQSGGRVLAIGANASRASAQGQHQALRFAEREAQVVAQLWPEEQSTTRVGAETQGVLSSDSGLGGYEVIHIASHASVLRGNLAETILLLAGVDGEALTADAIRELDLTSELVFLSACESGGGQDTRSAYAGMAASFLDAGARSVLASTAVVDDEAALAFSRNFYRHYLNGSSVPDALRQSQLKLRDSGEQWSHPFYWSHYQVSMRFSPD